MSKRRRLRRSLAVLVLLAILFAGAWTGLWYVIAGRLADHVLAWEQQRRAAGWTITHGTPRRTGWPMAAGMTLPGIAVSGAAQYLPDGLAWQAGALTLALDIRHPNDLHLAVTGRQSLRVAGGPAISFQAAKLAGQLALLPGDRPGLVQLGASNLVAAIPSQGGAPAPLSIARLDAAVRADGAADAAGAALIVAAQMTGIGAPPHLLPGLGPKLQSLSFDAALSGPVPQPGGAPAPEAVAAAWRDAGGSLALRAFHLADGPLTLDGEGRFQLDAFLRPEGNLALRAAGVDATMDRLAANRSLTAAEARAIKAMAGLMMRPPDPGVLQAPIGLRGGLVSLGSIPLLRLGSP